MESKKEAKPEKTVTPDEPNKQEADFFNMAGNAYGIYLFEPKPDDGKIIKDNYRLAWFGALAPDETLDTIRARFSGEDKPFDGYIPRENGIRFGAGDIIAIKKDGEITPWYTDMLAFSIQNAFFMSSETPGAEQDIKVMPDSKISLSERDLYGYNAAVVLPLLKERALELYDADYTVYMLYADNTEAMVFERGEILSHDGIFGIDAAEWLASKENAGMVKALESGETLRENQQPEQYPPQEKLEQPRFDTLKQTNREQGKPPLKPDVPAGLTDGLGSRRKKPSPPAPRKKPSILGQVEKNKIIITKNGGTSKNTHKHEGKDVK